VGFEDLRRGSPDVLGVCKIDGRIGRPAGEVDRQVGRAAGAVEHGDGVARVTQGCRDRATDRPLAAVVLGLVFGGLSFAPPWPALGWLALLSVSSQTIGWLLITSSLRRLPAAVASLLLLLQPAGSLVLAAVILGEQPTLLQVAGAVLVCGGIVAANGVVPWLRRRPVPAVTP